MCEGHTQAQPCTRMKHDIEAGGINVPSPSYMFSARTLTIPFLCLQFLPLLPVLLYQPYTYTSSLGHSQSLLSPGCDPGPGLWALGRVLALGFPSLTCCSPQAVITMSFQTEFPFLLSTLGLQISVRTVRVTPALQLHCGLSASSAHTRILLLFQLLRWQESD